MCIMKFKMYFIYMHNEQYWRLLDLIQAGQSLEKNQVLQQG